MVPALSRPPPDRNVGYKEPPGVNGHREPEQYSPFIPDPVGRAFA
jgi:hypothetical protein